MLESETCNYINKKLKAVGWDASNHLYVTTEFLITHHGKSLFADYVLHDIDGTILAIIEAKEFSRSARDGQYQALEYAQIIGDKQGFMPMIFLCNGRELFVYDSIRVPRKVATFFTLEDLRKYKVLHELKTPASDISINPDISGRHYQMTAIKRVTEGIDQGKRSFLLIMATGTGKTRTAMGLIDVVLRSHHVQKVLFLCDRVALRDQAHDDGFKPFFKDEPMHIIQSNDLNLYARLYTSTYQTMIHYLDIYSSGFFDLIIVDEVHRSIYGDWGTILRHFDAMKVGLTATPVEFIERNTYETFGCKSQDPTYSYGLDEAVREGYLVPYNVVMARTKFQIQGIKGRTLPENIKNQLIKEGKSPEDYNFEGHEIEKKITSIDTNRTIVREFMESAVMFEDGLPGKTIIFAMNQKHAEKLREAFEELYPELLDFTVVITSNVERADALLKSFKKNPKDKRHRIAISVDMMDTGIDVPEVVNLVFAKKVFSEAKFWQMIGRGTRLCPDLFGTGQDKTHFQILDFFLNFDEDHKFKPLGNQALPLQQQLFEAKIELYKLAQNRNDKVMMTKVRSEMTHIIQQLPENDATYSQQDHIAKVKQGIIRDNIAINPLEHLQKLAPLMRYWQEQSIEELKFLIKCEQCIIGLVGGNLEEQSKLRVANDLNKLSRNISVVQDLEQQLNQSLTKDFWEDIGVEDIEELKKIFTPLMKYKDSSKPDIPSFDRPDQVVYRRMIAYSEGGNMASDKYRKEFVNIIKEDLHDDPAIIKLIAGEPISKHDFLSLEKKLELYDYRFVVGNLRQVFMTPTVGLIDLVQAALDLKSLPGWKEEVEILFNAFISGHNFTSQQLVFLSLLKQIILTHRHISITDLYHPSIESSLGIGAVDRLFAPKQVEEIMEWVSVMGI